MYISRMFALLQPLIITIKTILWQFLIYIAYIHTYLQTSNASIQHICINMCLNIYLFHEIKFLLINMRKTRRMNNFKVFKCVQQRL